MIIYLKSNTVLAAVISIVFYLPVTIGMPYSITDNRARNLDTTPVLGRGYNIGTNSFQSTCLLTEHTTTPSYNYDYTFIDFSKTENRGDLMDDMLSETLSYDKVKDKMDALEESLGNGAMGALGKIRIPTRIIVSTMRIDRYYSSLREEVSPLTTDARTLLADEDYIGFFKTCGANYVRGIRRAQELTTIFTFLSPSEDRASEFAAELKSSNVNATFSTKSKFSDITSSLDIDVLGFGLGGNHTNSDALIVTTLEDLNKLMKFAIRAFTENDDYNNIGLVYGIEVVPWVDNTAFQVVSNVLDATINIPLPYSLIPQAFSDDTTLFPDFSNIDTTRAHFTCRNSLFHIDMNGYCCQGTELYNTISQAYELEAQNITSSSLVCRPVRELEKFVVKNNMSNNGEFVARLDSIIRYKMNQLFTLEQCINSVNTFPKSNEHSILKPQARDKYDENILSNFTVKQLKMALDPLGDFGLIIHMGRELDEFVEMYYRPCIAALFGMNIGSSPDTDPQYFMAYAWLQHDACRKFTCLGNNMRWDRNQDTGCVKSVISGGNVTSYTGETGESECSRNDENSCKYLTTELSTFANGAQTCWGQSTVPFNLMNHFCMPQIARAKVTGSVLQYIDQVAVQCTVSTPLYRQLRGSSTEENVQDKRPSWLTKNIESVGGNFL